MSLTFNLLHLMLENFFRRLLLVVGEKEMLRGKLDLFILQLLLISPDSISLTFGLSLVSDSISLHQGLIFPEIHIQFLFVVFFKKEGFFNFLQRFLQPFRSRLFLLSEVFMDCFVLIFVNRERRSIFGLVQGFEGAAVHIINKFKRNNERRRQFRSVG